MTVLVTGSAGFIGSHLCDALLEAGEVVVGLDNFDDFYERGIKERNLVQAMDFDSFSMIEGDVRDSDAWDSLPDGITSIVHLAAKAGVRPSIADPSTYWDVNVLGTARLFEFAQSRDIGSVVFASSSSVYGNCGTVPFSEALAVDRPISPYAATKKSGELLCHVATHLTSVNTVCLRFFTAYGPRQRPDLAIHKFATLLSNGEPIPMFGDGSTSRDYTYITDIVDGVVRGIEWVKDGIGRHEVVNLGESRTVSLSELIATLSEEMGVQPNVEQLPMQPGDVERTYADISKARALLGYDPQTDFREGIRSFLQWLRQR